MGFWGTIAVAVLSGGGSALLLELVVRPLRQRKEAARLIMHELNVNRLAIAHHLPTVQVRDNGVTMAGDLVLSTRVPGLLGSRMGTLPPDVLTHVLHIYTRFDHLRGISESYHRLSSEERSPLADPLRHLEVQRQISAAVGAFSESAGAALSDILVVCDRLNRWAKDKQWTTHEIMTQLGPAEPELQALAQTCQPPGNGNDPENPGATK